LKASYFLFALLALAFAAGNRLAGVNAYKIIFKDMTATHVGLCLGAIAENPIILAWLIAFVLIGACLFVNTACCTTVQIRSLFRSLSGSGVHEKRPRAVQMALIHIAALMVIGLHALDITMIERHKPIKLFPGETVSMGGYDILVKDIFYVTDRSMITENENGRRKKIFHIPEKDFSLEDNFVRIQIKRDDAPPEIRELRILSPVRLGSSYFFLDGFFIPHESRQIGAMIHLSTNPLIFIFFTVYSVLFCLLLIRYVTIWSEAPEKNGQIRPTLKRMLR